MARDKSRRHKKNPSFHQKYMTAWMIALAILAIVLFTTLLYLINIWSNPEKL